ncbi:MAG: autotransporter domain-containing protein [Methylophilaceae bacterium]
MPSSVRKSSVTAKSTRFNKTIIAQAVALSLSALAVPAFAMGPMDICTTANTTISAVAGGSNCVLGNGESVTVNAGVTPFSGVSTGIAVSSNVIAGSITNSGTVSGNSRGIGVYNTSTVSSITNKLGGTISGGNSTGIVIGGGSTVGTITNNGTINFGTSARGISISSSTVGSITNTGSISNTGSSGVGIDVSNIGSTVTGSITNSGTITTGDAGIQIRNGHVGGDIINTKTGVINVNDGRGIYLRPGSTVTGSIINNGAINSRSTGIYVDNSTVTGGITNSGSITNGTGGSHGIGITNGAHVGTITNSGTISAPTGIYARNLSMGTSTIGGITNSGLISATGDGINLLFLTAVNGNIVNSGTINAGSSNAGIAINGGAGTSITGSITNSNTISGGNGIVLGGVTLTGSITNSGKITGLSGSGIQVGSSTVQGDIVNSGTITAVYGIGVYGSTSSVRNITNSGTIATTQTAIYVGAGTVTGGITNSGTITAKYGVYLATAATVTGGITNSGTINASAIGNAVYINNVMANSLSNLAGGVINGTFTTPSGSLNVSNAGTVYIASNQISAYTGSYTQTSTGKLSIEAGATTAPGNGYGALQVTGAVSLPASAGIFVKVHPSSVLVAGNVLSGVVTSTGLTASTFAITDNSFALNFAAAINGNNVDLTASAGTGSSVSAIVAGAGNGAAGGVAAILDGLNGGSTTDADIQDFINKLASLGTAQEVSDAIAQALPLTPGATVGAVIDSIHNSSKVILAHLESERGLSAGDDTLTNRYFWFKPFGSWGDQDNHGGVSGYDSRSFGSVFGADAELSDTTRLGVALSLAHSRVDSKSIAAPQNTSINTYQAIVYGSHSLDDATELSFQADAGLSQNDGARTIGLLTASSGYNSTIGHVGVGASHSYQFDDKTTLLPSVRIDYTHVHTQGYTETGAGGLNLSVASDNTDELILLAEGKVNHSIRDGAFLSANLGAGYDALSERSSITSSFVGGGAAFTTQGIDPSAWLVRGGAGLTMNTGGTMEVTARYDFEVKRDFLNQTASVKFKLPF